MQKRIVILGGVGFIGTHLCLRLLEEGHEVFCVDIRDAVNSPLLRSVLQHPLFRYVHHNIINTFGIRCDEITTSLRRRACATTRRCPSRRSGSTCRAR